MFKKSFLAHVVGYNDRLRCPHCHWRPVREHLGLLDDIHRMVLLSEKRKTIEDLRIIEDFSKQ